MWRLKALARLILPVPVFLNLLAAPLCVFSLGIKSQKLLSRSCLGAAGRGCLLLLRRSRLWLCFLLLPARNLFGRGQDGVHGVTFHARPEFHNSFFADFLDEPLQNVAPQVLVGHLASAEAKAGLYLVAFCQEAQHVVSLGHIIVL